MPPGGPESRGCCGSRLRYRMRYCLHTPPGGLVLRRAVLCVERLGPMAVGRAWWSSGKSSVSVQRASLPWIWCTKDTMASAFAIYLGRRCQGADSMDSDECHNHFEVCRRPCAPILPLPYHCKPHLSYSAGRVALSFFIM